MPPPGLKKLDLVRQSCDARLCLTEKTLNQMRRVTSMLHTWPPGLRWERSDVVARGAAAAAAAEFDALGTEVRPRVRVWWCNIYLGIDRVWCNYTSRARAASGVEGGRISRRALTCDHPPPPFATARA
jgi:hypothetical protein